MSDPRRAAGRGAALGDRLVSLSDPIDRRVTYGYDSTGRLSSVVDKLGNAAGQDPSLHTWTNAYDGTSNHISSITDPDARVVVVNTYDTLGRLWTQKDGTLNTTTFGYPAGQVTICSTLCSSTGTKGPLRSCQISLEPQTKWTDLSGRIQINALDHRPQIATSFRTPPVLRSEAGRCSSRRRIGPSPAFGYSRRESAIAPRLDCPCDLWRPQLPAPRA
jgi:YD repeat-containing protein